MAKKKSLTDEEKENLVAYLDGELEEQAARALEAKLSIDPNARAEAESLRRSWELLDYLPRPEPSPNFTHRTMERLTAHQTTLGRSQPWARLRPFAQGAGWAAAVLLAAALGFASVDYLSQRHRDQQLVKDLRLIENLSLLENVDDIDFLHKLANPKDPDMFGDDAHGS